MILFTGKFTRKIEDYEILDKIGRGKYAQVFSAIQIQTGQKVALKILKPSKLISQQEEVSKGNCNVVFFERDRICSPDNRFN